LSIDVEAFYRKYGLLVLSRCRDLLRDEREAEDAMQDVFVQLVRHQRRLHDTAPSSLLLRIATNVCLNRLRTRRRHPEDPDPGLLERIAAAPDLEAQGTARLLLQRVFAGQRESTKVMAVLHLRDGWSLEEVAEHTGMSVSGVRKRLRGLKAWVAELEGVEP
jgi:RNA polymerase sigma-70 factor (ECF subfamily)